MNTKDRQEIVEEVIFYLQNKGYRGGINIPHIEVALEKGITLTGQKARDEIIRKIDSKIDGHSEQLKNTKEAGIILNIENRILSLKELKQLVKE